jgi:hypothetical protein
VLRKRGVGAGDSALAPASLVVLTSSLAARSTGRLGVAPNVGVRVKRSTPGTVKISMHARNSAAATSA